MEQLDKFDRQLMRCLEIAFTFDYESRSLTPDEIYEKFYPEKSTAAATKNFQRDRELLGDAGIKISFGSDGNYAENLSDITCSNLVLNEEESAALAVALQSMSSEESFPLPLALRFALLKLSGKFEEADPYMALSRMTLDDNTAGQQHFLEQLFAAIKNNAFVTFTYKKPQKDTKLRTVKPLGLHLFRGQWYLIAEDIETGRSPKTFSVANIANPVTSDTTFVPPEQFDVTTYCTPPFMWGEDDSRSAAVLIPSESAHRVENITAGFGSLDARPDGSTLWSITYNDIDRLCEYVLSEDLMFDEASSAEADYLRTTYLERVVNAHA